MAEHEKDKHGKEEGHKKHKRHSHGHGGGGHGGGHEEGVPEWVISFADNALLQMGFFVILLAMNMGPKAKSDVEGEGDQPPAASEQMLDMAIAVRESFNNPVSMDSSNPADRALVERLKRRSGGRSNEPGPKGDHDDVQSIRPGDYYRLGGVIAFEDGSAELKPSAQADAANIAIAMRGRNTVIEIRGFASAPESFPDVQVGMRLSYERSMAVAQALVAAGVNWNQLRLVASGDNDRVRPLATERSQFRVNQRVEVIATEDLVPADPYSQEGDAASGRSGE